jgi:hypothetical protein
MLAPDGGFRPAASKFFGSPAAPGKIAPMAGVGMSAEEGKRALLRHAAATVAYRGGKALRGAPPGFSDFRAAGASRSAGEILAHVADLFDWALSLAEGKEAWSDSRPGDWEADVGRFFESLGKFDSRLADPRPVGSSLEKLFQGPVADALTHVGQIAMLRRLAGAPVKGENYQRAEIAAGRVGAEQQPPRREFD